MWRLPAAGAHSRPRAHKRTHAQIIQENLSAAASKRDRQSGAARLFLAEENKQRQRVDNGECIIIAFIRQRGACVRTAGRQEVASPGAGWAQGLVGLSCPPGGGGREGVSLARPPAGGHMSHGRLSAPPPPRFFSHQRSEPIERPVGQERAGGHGRGALPRPPRLTSRGRSASVSRPQSLRVHQESRTSSVILVFRFQWR